MKQLNDVSIEKTALAVCPDEAARLVGIGRTTLYAALSQGHLRSSKIGKRRVITIEALKDWLAACEVKNSEISCKQETSS